MPFFPEVPEFMTWMGACILIVSAAIAMVAVRIVDYCRQRAQSAHRLNLELDATLAQLRKERA